MFFAALFSLTSLVTLSVGAADANLNLSAGLPEDVLKIIISNLPDEVALSARSTCRSWKEIVDQLLCDESSSLAHKVLLSVMPKKEILEGSETLVIFESLLSSLRSIIVPNSVFEHIVETCVTRMNNHECMFKSKITFAYINFFRGKKCSDIAIPAKEFIIPIITKFGDSGFLWYMAKLLYALLNDYIMNKDRRSLALFCDAYNTITAIKDYFYFAEGSFDVEALGSDASKINRLMDVFAKQFYWDS